MGLVNVNEKQINKAYAFYLDAPVSEVEKLRKSVKTQLDKARFFSLVTISTKKGYGVKI